MAAVTYIKLIAEAKKLIPRFYREYKGASDWWHAVKIDGKVFELNFTTHDPEGTGSFPKKKQDKVKIVAYPNGIDGKFVRLGYFQGMRQTNQNPKRCWKGYAPVRGKKPYSKGSCRKVRGNPAKSSCREIYDDNWDDKEMILVVERTLKPVCIGQKVKDFRGDSAVVTGGYAPRTPPSSGRVSVKQGRGERSYYPNVYGMKWVPSMNIFPVDRATDTPRYKINPNPAARRKLWKLGENGGYIRAIVNEAGNVVQITNSEYSDKPIKDGAYGAIFRWPLDRFNLEMHLTNFTTSYYASKIIEWVESVTKGTSMNGRKADKIADKTRGVDVFVFMKDKFAYSESEDDIDKISRKNKGRDIGGGTDMRTGLREKQYYFRSNGDATRFIKMVKKLGVMKGYRASYADSANEWPYKSKPIRLNPAPAGYHYMPDGRLMADSGHSKNPPELFKKGGYAVVVEFKSGDSQIGEAFPTEAQANSQMRYLMQQYARLKLTRGLDNVSAIRVLPVTSVAR